MGMGRWGDISFSLKKISSIKNIYEKLSKKTSCECTQSIKGKTRSKTQNYLP